MTITSISNDNVIKSNDYAGVNLTSDTHFEFVFDTLFTQRRPRLDPSICPYADPAQCSAAVFRRSVLVSEERSYFGGEWSCFGGAVVFGRRIHVEEAIIWKRLLAFRRRSDFDYSFDQYLFVFGFPISQWREVVLGGDCAEAKPFRLVRSVLGFLTSNSD